MSSLSKVVNSWFSKLFSSPDKKSSPINANSFVSDSTLTDEEIYNIVTDYGRYDDIWEIYRTRGWLEAIKRRDARKAFDFNISLKEAKKNTGTPLEHENQPIFPQSTDGFSFNLQSTSSTVSKTIVSNDQKQLDQLDIALIQSVASYFESMINKILHYHHDHRASREEAEVIVTYYSEIANKLRKIKTKTELSNIIDAIENLKKKVNRYQHESLKYRWSYGLDKNALAKLKSIVL